LTRTLSGFAQTSKLRSKASTRNWEELDAGNRPDPNLVNLTDEASSIIQMEQMINDIVRYGGCKSITTGLINGVEDSDAEFREPDHRSAPRPVRS